MQVEHDPLLINNKSITIQSTITKNTPALILTTEFFFFGKLEAFTDDFSNVRDKFYISHIDGEPQISQLIETMSKWKDKFVTKTDEGGDLVVFLPNADVPLPIVVQLMHWLKQSKLFNEIVLASDLI